MVSPFRVKRGGTAQELADRLRSYYGIKLAPPAPEPGTVTAPSTEKATQGTAKTITIESARTSEYFNPEGGKRGVRPAYGKRGPYVKGRETVYRLSGE